MSTRVRRRRLSPARRAAPVGLGNYRRMRAAIGLAILLLVFCFIWMINGSFTAAMVMGLGGTLSWGWAAHFINSALEVLPMFLAPYLRDLVVPRGIVVFVWLLSLPFGAFDVFSSAVQVAPWFAWTGASGILQHTQNTLLAELIAFLPEPMIIWLFLALFTVVRSRS